MNTETISLWLENGQAVDDLIGAYLMKHPKGADKQIPVIDCWSDEEEDSQESPLAVISKA